MVEGVEEAAVQQDVPVPARHDLALDDERLTRRQLPPAAQVVDVGFGEHGAAGHLRPLPQLVDVRLVGAHRGRRRSAAATTSSPPAAPPGGRTGAGSMTAGTGGASSGSMAHQPGRSARTSSWNWRTHSEVAPSGSSSQSPVGGRSPPTVIVKLAVAVEREPVAVEPCRGPGIRRAAAAVRGHRQVGGVAAVAGDAVAAVGADVGDPVPEVRVVHEELLAPPVERHELRALPVDLEPPELVAQRPQQRPVGVGPLDVVERLGVARQPLPGVAQPVDERRPSATSVLRRPLAAPSSSRSAGL